MLLQPGIVNEISFPVTSARTAKSAGSGTLDVLATPVLLAFMEKAAWTAVAPLLPDDSSTVGTELHVRHTSPTPVGMEVVCRAELVRTDGRRLVFRVTARDEAGLIGEGSHERVVIQNARFLTGAQRKKETGGI